MPDNVRRSSPQTPSPPPMGASRFVPPLPVLLICVVVLSGLWLYLALATDPGMRSWLLAVRGNSAARVETLALRGVAGPHYQVYFTKPQYPEDGTSRVGGLDGAVVADLDRAQRRIDVLTFDLDLLSIADALLRAHRRGVRVRVAVDGENLATPMVARLTGDLQMAGIPVSIDRRSAFMHNKLILIDDRIVWTGSWNLTVNDTFRNNNNMLRLDGAQLAASYAAGVAAIFARDLVAPPGRAAPRPQLALGSSKVISAFAPQERVTHMLVEQIDATRQQIDVLAFAFTSDPIAEALIAATARGVKVRGVVERRNASGSSGKLAQMRQAGLDFYTDGNCYTMHHKVMIIDGAVVITGSFNFSDAAQARNDENMMIIHDRDLAAQYSEEFQRVYAQALRPQACQQE